MSLSNEFIRETSVPLTDDEIIAAAKKLAELHQRADGILDEKTAVNAEFKAKLEEVKAQVAELARKVTEGVEIRPVVCRRVEDPISLQMHVVRVDTGTIVESRTMTAQEAMAARQLKLVPDDDFRVELPKVAKTDEPPPAAPTREDEDRQDDPGDADTQEQPLPSQPDPEVAVAPESETALRKKNGSARRKPFKTQDQAEEDAAIAADRLAAELAQA